MATLTPTEEKTDCFRLLSLIIDGGTLVLRHRFDQAITPADLQNKLNDSNVRGKLNSLWKRKVFTQVQWNLLYPATGQPSSANFDVSLLVCLLKYICGLNEQSTAWNCIPPSFDTSVEADITKLRLFRNEMLHMNSVSLTKQDFQKKWNEMEQVILRLGTGIPNLHKDIQNLKGNSIDPVNDKAYQERLTEWEKMDKLLQLEIEEIKTELKDCVEESENIKQSVADGNNRLDELNKQIINNSSKIETAELKQMRESVCIDRLSADAMTHENKITRIEEKQGNFEHNIQRIRERCDNETAIIYQRLDAVDTVVQSKDRPGEVPLEVKHLASIAKVYLEDSALCQVYVRTHSHEQAKAKLMDSGCIILSGLPGEGKTSMATKLIADIGKADSCLKLQEPSDWKYFDLSMGRFDTIFIDDIFGAGVFDKVLFSGWSRLLPDIEKAVKKKILNVIITTRHYILVEAKEKMQRLNLFQDENIQLLVSSELTGSERAEILETHLKDAEKQFSFELVQDCNTSYEMIFARAHYETPTGHFNIFRRTKGEYFKAMVGFPEIVRLFACNDSLFEMGPAFFEKPMLFFKKCVEDLFLSMEKFLALLLIWTRPKYVLNIKDLEPPEMSTEVETTARKFGFRLNEKKCAVLRESLKYHQNGYLRYDTKTGNYTFCHNIVKDMVGLVTGQNYPEAVLEFASEEFLMQYITTDQTKNNSFLVFIEEFRFHKLNTVMCNTFREIRPPASVTQMEEEQKTPSFIYDDNFDIFSTFNLLKKCMNKVTVVGNYVPLRDLPMTLGDDELLVNVSMLQHDCFTNRSFVNIFLESVEGKDVLSRPVIKFSGQFGYYGIDLGKREVHVHLPTHALLKGNSVLLEEFLKQTRQPYFGNSQEFLCLNLLVATHKDNQNVVDLLLIYGAEITEDALLIAAGKKDTKMLCFLLEHPRYKYSEQSHIISKNSPLISATKRGNVRSVQCLLQHGVDINYRNKNGLSALDIATLYINRTEVGRILLENGAEVNYRTPRFKRTPLHTVADIGNKEKTELLLQHGASVHLKDYRGHYPIHCAAIQGHIDVVEILLKADRSQADLKITSYGTDSKIKGMHLIHIAVWKNNPELLDLLLRYSVNPNARDYYGRTSIYCAVYKTLTDDGNEKSKNLKIINQLLNVANVKIADRDGYTPLHAAIHRGNTEVAKLICPFADVNARDKYGKTPLHTACEKRNIELFKLLIHQYHADVRMFTKNGQCVMHIALGKYLISNCEIQPGLMKRMPRPCLLLAEQYVQRSGDKDWAEIKQVVESYDPEFAKNWIDLECRFASGKNQ